MDASQRIILNTIAQYGKSIINILLSLYSTRLVLEALNVNDYGIYSVVGGVIGVLGYLANSLVVTTQRFLSFHQGGSDKATIKILFSNSLLLHLLIGGITCLILIAIENYVVNEFLNIEHHRLIAASNVYWATVVMFFITIITSPFKALLIAHENIIYISVIEVIDGLLKVALAFALFHIDQDRLSSYAVGMSAVLLFNLATFVFYCFKKYEESHIQFHRSTIQRTYLKQLLSFAGWTTYGMTASMCQTQGLSIVFNKFFGTAINAAYGIGMQVNGAVRFVSTSILNAMNPQIMKAEGNGNRSLMLGLAAKESKFSTALMLIISLPIIIEMPNILGFWLTTTPPHAILFCRALLIAFLVDQLTLGLHTANQAIGQIKIYSILMFTPKMLIVPIAWGALKFGINIEKVMWVYVGIELIISLARLPFLKATAQLPVIPFIKQVILSQFPIALGELLVCMMIVNVFDFKFRFLFSIALSIIVGGLCMLFFTLGKDEKAYLKKVLNHKIKRG
ncbi:MAG: hypothetical protein SOX84_05630 [Prevotella sp.]|nr:hypothetical protein [Prevotella sp.]MDY4218245.1 hypothetical protein [Prevotella sp.]